MKRVILLLFCLSAASCQSQDRLLPTTEFVLPEGMIITATNSEGTITVSAGPGTERTFSGKGWSKKSDLIPRTTRWYGSLGLYDPAGSDSPYGRVLVDEGRLFFKNESEALRYLYTGSDYSKPVFNNHGMVVGYHVENIPGGEPTRSIEIWQIYINGKRPQSIRGADDAAIIVQGGSIPDEATPHDVPVGLEMTLGEKEYSPEEEAKPGR